MDRTDQGSGPGVPPKMIIVGKVDISQVRRHEESTAANARLGGYGMDACCPLSEFQCFRVVLERKDVARLFLLPDFAAQTIGRSCRMRDVVSEASALPRVASFITTGVD